MMTEYEAVYKSITEMKCLIGGYPSCSRWMCKADLGDHLRDWHPDENQNPAHYWEIETLAKLDRLENGPR